MFNNGIAHFVHTVQPYRKSWQLSPAASQMKTCCKAKKKSDETAALLLFPLQNTPRRKQKRTALHEGAYNVSFKGHVSLTNQLWVLRSFLRGVSSSLQPPWSPGLSSLSAGFTVISYSALAFRRPAPDRGIPVAHHRPIQTLLKYTAFTTRSDRVCSSNGRNVSIPSGGGLHVSAARTSIFH